MLICSPFTESEVSDDSKEETLVGILVDENKGNVTFWHDRNSFCML